MPYIQRSSDGKVIAMLATQTEALEEWVAGDDPALQAFLREEGVGVSEKVSSPPLPGAQTGEEIAETDLAFVRVIEDVVDILIAKHLIAFTDLPPAVQNKLLMRKQLRSQLLGGVSLEEEARLGDF